MKGPHMDFHPIASIFPLLGEEDLKALAADIAQNGLREPVVLYEGKVLDGRNRWRACELAGATAETKDFVGDRRAALRLVWSANFHRRHLNPGQKAVAEFERAKLDAEYGAEVEKMKAEAQARMAQAKDRPRGEKASASPLMGQEIDAHERRTLAVRAKAAGTSRTYLEAAEKLGAEHPEKLAAVKSGEKTLSQVIREVKHEEAQAGLAELPADKFRVVYADPPWSYGGTGLDQYGPAERHYPSMTIAQLCALDIKSITHENAVLFLWVTSPLLAECWPVIAAWGFNYKTSFVWDKVKHNFGHYNSVRHELLLVCTRGRCTPDAKELVDSVQTIERSAKHSEKPEQFRAIIEKLYTQGKRLELFARGQHAGWSAWGNEAAAQ